MVATLLSISSTAPASSPIAIICTTISGNTEVERIPTFIGIPADTSFLTNKIASRNTALPAAPAAESNAPIRGTPAAKVVAKVRVNLATEAFIRMSPIKGIFRIFLSTASLSFRDFLWALANKVPAANITPAIIKP